MSYPFHSDTPIQSWNDIRSRLPDQTTYNNMQIASNTNYQRYTTVFLEKNTINQPDPGYDTRAARNNVNPSRV